MAYLPFHYYTIERFKEVEEEAKETKGFYFFTLSHRRYDPKGMVGAHCNKELTLTGHTHIENNVTNINARIGTMWLEN